MKNLVDLHTHTIFSNHAYSSLTENISEAYDVGLLYYGHTDHQPDNVGVGAHRHVFVNFKEVPKQIGNMRILNGIELNIGEDFAESVKQYTAKLDYAVASIHGYVHGFKHSKEENTNFYLEAINTPIVKILGHIDDGQHPCDYYTVIKACKENKVFVEINNSGLVPDSFRMNARENLKEILRICKELKCPVIMNSDAHIRYNVGRVDLALEVLKENDFPMELVANYNIDLFKDYFNL
ncbi:MAG: PHP domain-containing protein [Erysipelotrichaceae bacterium]|nr:PHP domain-containing protein [Erysipelotrichaceae bacterium]